MRRQSKRLQQSGFSMIELLIALVIVLINVMGVAGLVVKTVQQEAEAYQRVEALAILQDMVDRINANRQVVSCYSNGATGVQVGKGGAIHDCGTSTAQEQAEADLLAWHNTLLGTEVAEGADDVGGMINARGCITQVNALERIYRVTVAWQGLSATTAPKAALTCGSGNYGDENLRRVVTALVRIGDLG